MSVLNVFSVCIAVFYQAQGAPQWVVHHGFPTPIVDARISQPPGYGPPPYPGPSPYHPLRTNLPIDLPPERILPVLDDGYSDYLDYSDGLLFRQNVQECNPRAWFRQSRCYNSTTIQSCTFGGILRYRQCPQSWSCNPTLGICLRSLNQVFPSRSFTCPTFTDNEGQTMNKIGMYPDPHSCKVYHNCTATNLTTTHCVYPQLYDPITQSCQMFNQDRPCYRFRCFGRRSSVAYPGDPLIFANCSSKGFVMSVDKCRYGAFNEGNQQCDLTNSCRREGNIAGPSPQTYYTCSRIFKRLVRSELRTCPGEITFDSTSGQCAPTTSTSTNQPPGLRELESYYLDEYQQDFQLDEFLLPSKVDSDFPVYKRSADSPEAKSVEANNHDDLIRSDGAPFQTWKSINALFMR